MSDEAVVRIRIEGGGGGGGAAGAPSLPSGAAPSASTVPSPGSPTTPSGGVAATPPWGIPAAPGSPGGPQGPPAPPETPGGSNPFDQPLPPSPSALRPATRRQAFEYAWRDVKDQDRPIEPESSANAVVAAAERARRGQNTNEQERGRSVRDIEVGRESQQQEKAVAVLLATRRAQVEREVLETERQAQKKVDQEKRRESLLELQNRAFLEAERQRHAKQASLFDMVLEGAQRMRGTLGGIFGTIVGAGLDLLATFRQIQEKASPARAEAIGAAATGGATAAATFGAVGGAVATYSAFKRSPEEGVATATAATATVAALAAFRDALVSGTRAIGTFAARVISPSADPSQFVSTIGSAVTATSKALFLVNPLLGTMGAVLGGAIESVSGFMQALDGMVERYAQYSPAVATAQAEANVTQILGDIRRAQEAAPDLVKYIQQRTDLQQRIEDAKVRFMNKLMPLAERIMEIAEVILPLVEGLVEVLGSIGNFTEAIPRIWNAVNSAVNDLKIETTGVNADDVMKAVQQGFVAPGSARERELERTDVPFVKAPRV